MARRGKYGVDPTPQRRGLVLKIRCGKDQTDPEADPYEGEYIDLEYSFAHAINRGVYRIFGIHPGTGGFKCTG